MKQALFILTIALFTSSTQAQVEIQGAKELEQQAFQALITENPMAKALPEKTKSASVAKLLSVWTVSSFNASGIDALSVVSNDCEYVGRSTVLACVLSVHNEDMKEDFSGGYIPVEDGTESSLKIYYKVLNNKLHGEVTYFTAG